MEIILAIVVASAVIFFGALISMGNERQRRAIDGLREQMVLWAVQDLKIKRERFAHDVKIDDPISWISKLTSHICKRELDLHVVDSFESPRALSCEAKNENVKVIFSPLSPNEIRSIKRTQHNALTKYTNINPIFSLPKDTVQYRVTSLNGGPMLDLELPIVWEGLTGQLVDKMDEIWIYIY